MASSSKYLGDVNPIIRAEMSAQPNTTAPVAEVHNAEPTWSSVKGKIANAQDTINAMTVPDSRRTSYATAQSDVSNSSRRVSSATAQVAEPPNAMATEPPNAAVPEPAAWSSVKSKIANAQETINAMAVRDSRRVSSATAQVAEPPNATAPVPTASIDTSRMTNKAKDDLDVIQAYFTTISDKDASFESLIKDVALLHEKLDDLVTDLNNRRPVTGKGWIDVLKSALPGSIRNSVEQLYQVLSRQPTDTDGIAKRLEYVFWSVNQYRSNIDKTVLTWPDARERITFFATHSTEGKKGLDVVLEATVEYLDDIVEVIDKERLQSGGANLVSPLLKIIRKARDRKLRFSGDEMRAIRSKYDALVNQIDQLDAGINSSQSGLRKALRYIRSILTQTFITAFDPAISSVVRRQKMTVLVQRLSSFLRPPMVDEDDYPRVEVVLKPSQPVTNGQQTARAPPPTPIISRTVSTNTNGNTNGNTNVNSGVTPVDSEKPDLAAAPVIRYTSRPPTNVSADLAPALAPLALSMMLAVITTVFAL